MKKYSLILVFASIFPFYAWAMGDSKKDAQKMMDMIENSSSFYDKKECVNLWNKLKNSEYAENLKKACNQKQKSVQESLKKSENKTSSYIWGSLVTLISGAGAYFTIFSNKADKCTWWQKAVAVGFLGGSVAYLKTVWQSDPREIKVRLGRLSSIRKIMNPSHN